MSLDESRMCSWTYDEEEEDDDGDEEEEENDDGAKDEGSAID